MPERYLLLWILLSGAISRATTQEQQPFIEPRELLTVTVGEVAQFQCHVGASVNDVSWSVNGNSVAQLSNPDISPHMNGSAGYYLSINARDVYNGTTVRCTALLLVNNSLSQFSSIMTELIIQGPLAGVTALTNTSSVSAISLTWDAPFSLDLSYFQVDILYRVEVCKVVGGETYNCSHEVVVLPEFSFTERGDDLFQFTVTPLSPRQDHTSLEGTASLPVTGFFRGAPLPVGVVHLYVAHLPLSAQLRLLGTLAPGRVPDCYSIRGETVDPGPPLLLQCADTCGTETGDTIVTLNESLCKRFLPDRIYNITVEARNGVGSANYSVITLSTHAVTQCHTSNSSNPGEVAISCTFAERAVAEGYFTILYPMTPGGGHPVVYSHTLGGDGTVNTTVEGLTDTSYMAVVFDIEPSGLPETLAAVLPQSVDGVGRGVVGSGQGPAHTSSGSTHDVVSTDPGVCVTSDSNGVAIIHSTNTTDSLKMMKLSALLLTGGMTNCTEPLPDGDYHVTVFTNITQRPLSSEVVSVVALAPTLATSEGLLTIEPTKVNTKVIIAFVVLTVLVVVGAVTAVSMYLACRHRRNYKNIQVPKDGNPRRGSMASQSGDYYQRVAEHVQPAATGNGGGIDVISSTSDGLHETVSDAQKNYERIRGYDLASKEPAYIQPPVAVGNASQDISNVEYDEVAATKSACEETYALPPVVTGGSTPAVDGDRVLYSKAETTETSFTAPPTEGKAAVIFQDSADVENHVASSSVPAGKLKSTGKLLPTSRASRRFEKISTKDEASTPVTRPFCENVDHDPLEGAQGRGGVAETGTLKDEHERPKSAEPRVFQSEGNTHEDDSTLPSCEDDTLEQPKASDSPVLKTESRPPEDDTAVPYREMGGIRSVHGITYAYPLVAAGSTLVNDKLSKPVYT